MTDADASQAVNVVNGFFKMTDQQRSLLARRFLKYTLKSVKAAAEDLATQCTDLEIPTLLSILERSSLPAVNPTIAKEHESYKRLIDERQKLIEDLAKLIKDKSEKEVAELKRRAIDKLPDDDPFRITLLHLDPRKSQSLRRVILWAQGLRDSYKDDGFTSRT